MTGIPWGCTGRTGGAAAAVLHASRGLVRRFCACGGGFVTPELALLLPVLIFAYAGVTEYVEVNLVEQRLKRVAEAVALAATGQGYIAPAELEGLLRMSADLVTPYNPAGLKLTISDFPDADAAVSSGQRPLWSFSQSVPRGATLQVHMVKVEARYVYASPVSQLLSGVTGSPAYTLGYAAMAAARNNDTVPPAVRMP